MPADKTLVGTADIQSLADLSNSFEVVTGMRSAPFTSQTVVQPAVTARLPSRAADADDDFARGMLERSVTIVC